MKFIQNMPICKHIKATTFNTAVRKPFEKLKTAAKCEIALITFACTSAHCGFILAN